LGKRINIGEKVVVYVTVFIFIFIFGGKEHSFHVVLGVEEENVNDFETKVQH
jgi:hypothetical protein